MGASIDPAHARAAHAGLGVTRFSTAGYAPRDRHEAWSTRDWPSLASMLDTRPLGAFDAETETIALGPVNLNFGQYGAQAVERPVARTRGDGIDHLTVTMLMSGRLDGDWASFERGSFAICDLARPIRHVSTASELLTISIPRALATSRGLDPATLHGTTVGPAHSAMLRSHAFQIRAAAALIDAADGPRLANTVVDLLSVSLAVAGRSGPATAGARDLAARQRAEQLIAACVEDPRLGPLFLCRELGLSRATLYRLFAGAGGVQQRIRTARLHAAQRALLLPAARIGDVAARFGFADPAYFSRVFRAEFGLSPSDWKSGQAASAPPPR